MAFDENDKIKSDLLNTNYSTLLKILPLPFPL